MKTNPQLDPDDVLMFDFRFRFRTPEDNKAIIEGAKGQLSDLMDDVEIGRPAPGEPPVARVDQISVCVISQPRK